MGLLFFVADAVKSLTHYSTYPVSLYISDDKIKMKLIKIKNE